MLKIIFIFTDIDKYVVFSAASSTILVIKYFTFEDRCFRLWFARLLQFNYLWGHFLHQHCEHFLNPSTILRAH